MQQDTEKTKVVFRKYLDGEVIAIFPELYFDVRHKYVVTSYMHVGQHGDCYIPDIVFDTELATPEEYADLKEELESIGYNLDIRKRIQRKH